MEEIIIREGDQITVNLEDYIKLQYEYKIMTIALIIMTTIIAIMSFTILIQWLINKD